MIEIISAFSLVLTTIGVFLLLFRLSADHERTRREQLVKLMTFWVNTVNADPEVSAAVFFVNSLDSDACE